MRRLFEEPHRRCGYRKPPLVPRGQPTGHGFSGWLGTQQADPTLAVGDRQLLKLVLSAAADTLIDKLLETHVSPLEALRALLLGNDPHELLAALLGGTPPRALSTTSSRGPRFQRLGRHRGRSEGVFSVPLATWQGRRRGPRELLVETRAKVGTKLRSKRRRWPRASSSMTGRRPSASSFSRGNISTGPTRTSTRPHSRRRGPPGLAARSSWRAAPSTLLNC